MPASQKIDFRADEALSKNLEARNSHGSVGITAREQLERWFYVLGAERSKLRFSEKELFLIADVSNGTLWQAFSISLLWAEISDSLDEGYAEKWSVDGLGLVAKIKALNPAQVFALVDGIEQWWNLPSEQRNASGFETIGFKLN